MLSFLFSNTQNEVTQLTEADEVQSDDEVPGSPPPKKRALSLLASLLGDAFSENERPAVQTKTAFERAQEEMDLYCRAPALPLTSVKKDEPPETPMAWWHRHDGAYPLLSRLSKRYLCASKGQVWLQRECSPLQEMLSLLKEALSHQNT